MTPGPPRLVIETDFHSDVDDAGAIALAIALERSGQVSLAAVGVNTPSRWGVTALEVLCRHYGSEVPIGRHPEITDEVWGNDYARTLSERFAPRWTAEEVPLAVDLLRSALVAPDSPGLTIVSIGFFGNLLALLDSPPDAISSLTGVELVTRGVVRTVAMGGLFPAGREFNFFEHGADTRRFLAEWPLPIDFIGWEIADDVIIGADFGRVLGSTSPLSVAYEAYCNPGEGRASWDPVAVLAAALPVTDLLDWSEPGEVQFNDDGSNSWRSDPSGRHRHAVRNGPPTVLARKLDEILRWLA